ncbi:MAG: DUF1028 domain-containing protein [Ignavibacteriaceae bacterium]|nr:DUF1028 domain-containing protein [Ignavibacterium sp.]MCC6254768.1 DUF1028 domain-containing protein [Ignavibacteriaceae bacterium]HMN24219.1 DUF1028 domain-containing protein [Ignavibacteriaceae bacterium]HRN24987.1 DUF1028 domain-containing protein [Ignavibacteriaceae bacterium]HRP93416.1 DUF1028 domain-containing protein [Ignavibacteriaceae bacterium]
MKKMIVLICLLFTFLPIQIFPQTFFGNEPLAHTFSIVARDAETGEMGVAVQSHWFSVGSIVAWGEAGVGVVATQSFVNPSFGPHGLDLLKQGKTAQEVVDILIASDEGRDVRQLAIVDSKGNSASYTGAKCISEAGNIIGDNYSVQANMMLNNTVWGAMSKAFENSKGPLAERLITALEAAQNEGGDIRGKQSACLLVVRGTPTGNIWEDRLIDLRVEDNPNPIIELKRLLKVHRAYDHMNAGDLAVEKNDMKLAMDEYNTAMKMFPENLEMKYWTAISLANTGDVEKSLPMFKEIFEKDKNWKELTKRLIPVGLLTVDEKILEEIINQ